MIELHFQNGFSGETVEIEVDGRVASSFTARTRYQINLAHIEAVELTRGQEVVVRLPDLGISVRIPAAGSRKYYEISKSDEQIHVNATDDLPKYL